VAGGCRLGLSNLLFSFRIPACILAEEMPAEIAPGEDPRFPDERQERIAELIATRGKVRIAQLTELFGVSEPTVRKDLTHMEQRGLLKRTHGGAVSVRPPVEQAMASRFAENAEAKRMIAKVCVQLLSTGEAVFLDSGTTVQQIAHALVGSGLRLTILTDSPSVAEEVADLPGVSHLLIGGQLRRISGCLIGPLTTENLKKFTIGTAFIGASGISETGVTVSDLSEAELKAVVIARAQRAILPIDHSKVGVSDFAHVCDLADLDMVVTDEPSERLEKLCGASQVALVVAQSNGTAKT
jgi:DeoR/GlpR family transcriptional regulator of sugar metabolism